jgi:hypothetical protein
MCDIHLSSLIWIVIVPLSQALRRLSANPEDTIASVALDEPTAHEQVTAPAKSPARIVPTNKTQSEINDSVAALLTSDMMPSGANTTAASLEEQEGSGCASSGCKHSDEFDGYKMEDNPLYFTVAYYKANPDKPQKCVGCGVRFGSTEYKVSQKNPVYMCVNALKPEDPCKHALCGSRNKKVGGQCFMKLQLTKQASPTKRTRRTGK